MNRTVTFRSAMLGAVLFAGCATASGDWSARELRPATDTPTAFVLEGDEEVGPNECRSPLVDPRDQTHIRLVRSGRTGGHQVGDYEVVGGRYGVGDNELLRIQCSTGQVLGVVRN